MTRTTLRTTAAAIALLFAASSLPLSAALADPPPWAPAHGWRDKHDRDDDDWREPMMTIAGWRRRRPPSSPCPTGSTSASATAT